MKQKIIGFFALLYSIINCTSTNIKGREVWAEKQENIATLSPSYKLINKVSGQGCVTKGFLWGFDEMHGRSSSQITSYQ